MNRFLTCSRRRLSRNFDRTRHSRLCLSKPNRHRATILPALAAISWLNDDSRQPSVSSRHDRHFTTQMEKRKPEQNPNEEKNKQEKIFDITKLKEDATKSFWDRVQGVTDDGGESGAEKSNEKKEAKQQTESSDNKTLDRIASSLKTIFGVNNDEKDFKNESRANNNKTTTGQATAAAAAAEHKAPNGGFRDMATSFANLLAVGGSEETVRHIVKQARESAGEGDVSDKKNSNEKMWTLMQEYATELKKTADRFLDDVDFSQLYPSSLFYYIEHSDSIKTPSWKRQKHRFYKGIDIRQMEELNDCLSLALLAYADSIETIQEGLENNKSPMELVYAKTESTPNRPAHFVAVKRSQKIWSPWLEVVMCVRGTKTIEDVLTDCLCDYQDYKGGKAHSGLLEGGKYLAKKHKRLFDDILKNSGKPKLRLTLIGHSLGAGAASIIAMEYDDENDYDVDVIGFGCPALLSKDLSEKTSHYITTVVADDDCVPRMSAVSAVNALLDIMEYDYVPYARRDVQHALSELHRLYPKILTESVSQRIQGVIDPLMDQYLRGSIKETTTKRLEPVLFPPGNIIHFYRDGVGVTGSVVPCDFFDELHVSRRMVDDHLFFSGYQQIFLELMRQHHRDHNFSFDREEKK